MNTNRPKIGLALSAGAARGLCHLGAIQVLEEEGIPIDIIAGTSAGSLVGGLYAIGHEIKYLSKLAASIKWEHISELTIPKKGLIAGGRFLDFLRVLTHEKNIEECRIPFTAVATDLKRGERVLLNSGSLAEAIRASTSIPGIYVPFYKDGRMLVDGAIVERIPINVAREMGADIVIGVDVGFDIGNSKVSNIFEILIQSSDIMMREISRMSWPDADILIQPEVGHISAMDLRRANDFVEAGIVATRAKIGEIKQLTGVG